MGNDVRNWERPESPPKECLTGFCHRHLGSQVKQFAITSVVYGAPGRMLTSDLLVSSQMLKL